MHKTEIDELDGLLNSLDYHIDECSHDNNCGGRFPDVDACTVSELVVKSRKLIAYVRRLEKVRDAAEEVNDNLFYYDGIYEIASEYKKELGKALKEASDAQD